MADLTVSDTKIFGATGAHCDAQIMKMVEYSREFDFGQTAVAENASYELLPIPAGFLATHIVVKQETSTDQDVTITFDTFKDASKDIGGNFALKDLSGETELCFECQSVSKVTAKDAAGTGTVDAPKFLFFKTADILCLTLPNGLTGDKIAKGKIRVSLIGYQVCGSSLSDIDIGSLEWATGQSSEDFGKNKSGGDPMYVQP